MKTLLNTLYITNPEAYLRLEGDTICVELEKEKVLQVPLHHIGAVVCFGEALVTPAVMARCTQDGKSIAYLSRRGEFAARIEGATSGNVLLRLDQFQSYSDPVAVKEISQSIVAGKLNNSRQIVMRGARESTSDGDTAILKRVADLLASLQGKVQSTRDLDQLRGIEGEGAKLYFEALNKIVRDDQRSHFAMDGRSRRPPRDRMNAILSFLYTLLVVDCRAALEAVGLDPQIGFLHSVRPGRPALALDLAEEFRSVIADRVALTLVNRGQLKPDDFEVRPGGAIWLSDESRKIVIATYQKRKQEEINHPLVENSVPLGVIIHLQARLLARTIRKDMDLYLPFMYR